MKGRSNTENFQAEGTAPAKALSWVRKDMYLRNKRPLWLQKVSKGGEKEEGRLERPVEGRTYRVLKILKESEAALSCLQVLPPSPDYSWGSSRRGGMRCSQNNPKCN